MHYSSQIVRIAIISMSAIGLNSDLIGGHYARRSKNTVNGTAN